MEKTDPARKEMIARRFDRVFNWMLLLLAAPSFYALLQLSQFLPSPIWLSISLAGAILVGLGIGARLFLDEQINGTKGPIALAATTAFSCGLFGLMFLPALELSYPGWITQMSGTPGDRIVTVTGWHGHSQHMHTYHSYNLGCAGPDIAELPQWSLVNPICNAQLMDPSAVGSPPGTKLLLHGRATWMGIYVESFMPVPTVRLFP